MNGDLKLDSDTYVVKWSHVIIDWPEMIDSAWGREEVYFQCPLLMTP